MATHEVVTVYACACASVPLLVDESAFDPDRFMPALFMEKEIALLYV